ncbi:13986_t:CDS:2 [Dentiscutata heterogama]|uniref:13986_t:CDS:1 n=1 Tax=Dentiscutata heterogama TaxID=1316150 RepID=A0ACA9M5U8_9GLOM|nr:13986_t:CDS:2 [Dentiscutata heterogama]
MNQKVGDDYSTNYHVYTNCNSESVSELPIDNMKIFEERLRRYEYEVDQISNTSTLIDRISYLRKNRENNVSKAIINIEDSMNVDICFVLDCTSSMIDHIKAAKEHISKVTSYVNNNNSNIEFWVGLCGYRDHCDDLRLQIFDFTNSLKKFQTYMTNKVKAEGGGDYPEDVLGGLDAAITEMLWSNGLVFLFISAMRHHMAVVLPTYMTIIQTTTGNNPEKLVNKFCNATSSAIFSSITLTTTLRSSKNIYSLQRKKLQINPHEPDWTILPEKTGKLLYYNLPKTLAEVKDEHYFINSSFTEQGISFKLATQPFSIGAERYAYFALDTSLEQANKLLAFAHFTYQYSEGYLAVYDLQGVELDNEFLLTDPAIHY